MANEKKLFSTNWDDLKFFLLLKRHGRLSVAAKYLGTTHATVANRVSSLEKSLGVQLFIHDKGGFRPTRWGAKLASYAEECERQLAQAFENPEENDQIRAKVRVGVTEGLGDFYLSPRIARWMRTQNLEVDFISLPKLTNVTNREADISITFEKPHGEYVIRRHLTDYVLGLYASKGYISSNHLADDKYFFRDHLWIGYIDSMLFSKSLNYHTEIGKELNFVFNSTSIMAQKQAAISGLGISILPVYMAYDDSRLVRVRPDIRFVRHYWISTTKDIHRFEPVRLTWDFVLASCKADQSILNPDV